MGSSGWECTASTTTAILVNAESELECCHVEDLLSGSIGWLSTTFIDNQVMLHVSAIAANPR
jgi:hypothetical protein